MCLVGPTCFGLSVGPLAFFEEQQVGVQWDNLDQTYGDFKFGTSLWMLFLDTIIYIILTLYFDKVWPSRYGQRMHPLFFLSPSYWAGDRKKEDDANSPKTGLLHRQMSKFSDCFPSLAVLV